MTHELAAFDIDRVIDGGSVTSGATRFPEVHVRYKADAAFPAMITSKVPLTSELRVRVRR